MKSGENRASKCLKVQECLKSFTILELSHVVYVTALTTTFSTCRCPLAHSISPRKLANKFCHTHLVNCVSLLGFEPTPIGQLVKGEENEARKAGVFYPNYYFVLLCTKRAKVTKNSLVAWSYMTCRRSVGIDFSSVTLTKRLLGKHESLLNNNDSIKILWPFFTYEIELRSGFLRDDIHEFLMKIRHDILVNESFKSAKYELLNPFRTQEKFQIRDTNKISAECMNSLITPLKSTQVGVTK